MKSRRTIGRGRGRRLLTSAAHLTAAAALFLAGCTSDQLKQSSVDENNQLTDLEYHMVLNNLAMFVAAPNSVPWHLILTQGSVTINDSVNGALSYSAKTTGGITHDTGTFGIGASRMIQDQWNVSPISDTTILRKLQGIYNTERGNALTGPEDANAQHWFHIGFSPKGVGMPRGRYGDTVVWVDPAHIGHLNQLTLQILGALTIGVPAYLPTDVDAPRLGKAVTTKGDKFSDWLWTRFGPDTRKSFANFMDGATTPADVAHLTQSMVTDLNQIIATDNLSDINSALSLNTGDHAADLDDLLVRLFQRLNPPPLTPQMVSSNTAFLARKYNPPPSTNAAPFVYVRPILEKPHGSVSAPQGMVFFNAGPGYTVPLR